MAVPLIVIGIGVAWLLDVLNVVEPIDWVWITVLALAGVLCFVVGGVNKASIVAGPLLIVASVTSVLRQTGRLRIDVEIPLLTIVLGVLLFVSLLSPARVPDLLREEKQEPKQGGASGTQA